jgi:DNA-binding LacI/PurR family transcriptional regulator
MVTRNDVAKRAKVSPGVVSYVINDSNYVSEEKKRAVLKAIRELNYIPNGTARSLKKNKTFQIAVLRGSVLNDMFNDLLYYMEGIAYDKSYAVSLITVKRDSNMMAADAFIDDLIRRRYDAIFVANSSLQDEQINRLISYGIPVLLYNTRDYLNLDKNVRCLAPDYRKGVQCLIEMLIDCGHERIGFIPNMFYPNMCERTNHRFDGYVRAFESKGISVDGQYVSGLNIPNTLEFILDEVKDMFTHSKKNRPTALYADESIVLGTILKQLQDMGLRVPQDVSLVGSSASTISRLLTPRITSVGLKPEVLAQKAVDMMMELVAGQYPENCLMEMQMFKGESVKKFK